MSPHEPRVENALGASEGMCRVELLLRQVADSDSSLLITGESGVGKEVAAKFVHQISTRAGEPFVAVNCGAIPSELIESQLFGHEKGAFTSAQARHHGYVERARNGILFLDEVGELSMLTQVKMLRLIQERAFTRVGGETAIKTGARIIYATNTDLEAAVAESRFRRDLYYRINVIPIVIPPLRDRSDDILPLAQLFMREFSETFQRDIKGFTPGAEQALLNHRWPGNVRQLRNCVERAVALSQAPRIGVEALFPSGAGVPDGPRSQRSRRSSTGPSAKPSAFCSTAGGGLLGAEGPLWRLRQWHPTPSGQNLAPAGRRGRSRLQRNRHPTPWLGEPSHPGRHGI
jgi:DNA-binding NtrC family response regulator